MERTHDGNGNTAVAVVRFAGLYDRCGRETAGVDMSVRPFSSYSDSGSTTQVGTLHDESAGISGSFYDVNSGTRYGIKMIGNT